VPSRYEPMRELRELLIKRTFSGDAALTSVRRTSSGTSSTAIYENGRRAHEGVCAPRALGSENAQTQCAPSEAVAHHP
jgi:hypothetical protein